MYSEAELKTLCKKAFENAEDLIDDAGILLAKGKYARAYVLAHLACEELAKLPLIYSVRLELSVGTEIDWKSINKRLNSHEEKLKSMAFFDYLNNRGLVGDSESESQYRAQLNFVRQFNEIKNVGLYAGKLEGKVIAPHEAFGKELTKSMLNLAVGRVNCFKKVWPETINGEITSKHRKAYEVVSKLYEELQNA